jgi:Asp-tRNA(Asn)/Glu-tRNA(Gln) amidotransferase A subunit family amidase
MTRGGRFTVAGAVEASRAGKISAEDYVRACLDRIKEREDQVQAWAYLDADHALAQARRLDEMRHQGKPMGPLHGIPVGIKDVIDTADMPTEDGTPLHAGRRPQSDATVVAFLRQAGAVIMGKTVTTELAVHAPGKTRNPHDPARTPGGSSSGSAAAVAAGMVPFALGTQTNGSIIRPAAYCGVVGFKPTFGTISRRGVLHQSKQLDQVGVFANSVADAALLAETLMAYDDGDPDMRPQPRPALSRIAAEEPPLTPRLAFVKTPVWNEAAKDTKDAFAELTAFLGDRAVAFDLPEIFADAIEQHRVIFEAGIAASFWPDYERGKKKLSAGLRALIERGARVSATDYIRAVARIPLLVREIDPIFDGFDAILTPAATDVAPRGLSSTGSPVFCTLWTLLGTPTIALPLLQGENGMPMGAQLVARRGDDGRLLRTAQWLSDLVEKPKTVKRKNRAPRQA